MAAGLIATSDKLPTGAVAAAHVTAVRTNVASVPATSAGMLDTLQAFRAVAAAMVVLFHITNVAVEELQRSFAFGMFGFGYTGVDFFFVLSGFIIYFAHARDIGHRDRLRPYLLKRLIRILPLYWAVTLAKLTVLWYDPQLAKAYETEWSTVFASLLLLPQRHLPIIGAAWTLSHEMFFYLAFAAAILLGRRWSVVLFGGWVLVVIWSQGRVIDANHYAAFILNERNLEFALGCLAAITVKRRQVPFPRATMALGVALFLLSGWYVLAGGLVRSHTIYFGVPSWLIVMGAAANELRGPVRVSKMWLFLGAASYSIYLTHAMFIDAILIAWDQLNRLWTPVGPIAPLVLAVGSIAAASLVFVTYERPVLGLLKVLLLPDLGAAASAGQDQSRTGRNTELIQP